MLVAALGACSATDDAPTADPSPGTDAASTTTVRPSTISGIDPLTGASTDPRSGPNESRGFGQLAAVDLGRHEGFDRVVFTFGGDTVPGYQIRYVEPPIIEDGSGRTVTVDGDAYLSVRLEPASAYDMSAGHASYTGADRLVGSAAGTTEIREVVKTGDFEAVLNWVLGLADRVDFRVDTLTSPARIVIDVRNH